MWAVFERILALTDQIDGGNWENWNLLLIFDKYKYKTNISQSIILKYYVSQLLLPKNKDKISVSCKNIYFLHVFRPLGGIVVISVTFIHESLGRLEVGKFGLHLTEIVNLKKVPNKQLGFVSLKFS
jgi:hypothetical protein